jgi:hypothetical protein
MLMGNRAQLMKARVGDLFQGAVATTQMKQVIRGHTNRRMTISVNDLVMELKRMEETQEDIDKRIEALLEVKRQLEEEAEERDASPAIDVEPIESYADEAAAAGGARMVSLNRAVRRQEDVERGAGEGDGAPRGAAVPEAGQGAQEAQEAQGGQAETGGDAEGADTGLPGPGGGGAGIQVGATRAQGAVVGGTAEGGVPDSGPQAVPDADAGGEGAGGRGALRGPV